MARLSRGERVALRGGIVALVAALVLSAALFAEWLERPNPGFLIGFGPAGFEEAAEGSGYTLSYVVPFGPAAEAGLPANARVTAIEGVDVRDGKAIEELEQRLEVGQRIGVRYVDGQGRERTIAAELTREPLEPFVLMRIGASLLLAISMLVIGFTVFLKAPHDRRARVLLGFTLVYGIWFLLYDPLGAFGSPRGRSFARVSGRAGVVEGARLRLASLREAGYARRSSTAKPRTKTGGPARKDSELQDLWRSRPISSIRDGFPDFKSSHLGLMSCI